jgi:hypothetical protein
LLFLFLVNMNNDDLIASICLAAVIIIVLFLVIKNRKKEGFVSTTQGGRISETGAIRGPSIITDGMTDRPWDEMADEVNKTGYTNDGKQMLGVSQGDNFDSLFQNQLDIIDITKRASDGMFNTRDLGEISGKIASSANNNSHNIYSRGGTIPVKMIIAKNEIRGVIESKYLPERDKNRKLAAVDTIVHHKGFDINIERLGENLLDTHFSNSSSNKRKSRVPTAAGATGGGGGRFGKETEIETARSANFDAVNDNIKMQGDRIAIVKDVDSEGNREIVTTGIEGEAPPIHDKLALGSQPVNV